ncbi:cache domain-containing protein [Paraburkholderia fungorum]|uniref:cache domain-containing protein n=1 Tax=Paraburkholderia fungorum TaxID=134537 RepID=UPI0038BD582E
MWETLETLHTVNNRTNQNRQPTVTQLTFLPDRRGGEWEIWDAYQTRETRLDERKADLIHASEIALSVVKTFGDQAASGSITKAEAQTHAMDNIRNMRYGENGYFVILNSDPTVLMHPTHPEINGNAVADVKDPNGTHLYKDIVAVIKRDSMGFTAFAFPRPGATDASPKIGYSVSYQPWDWILSTAVYVDDIDEQANELKASVSIFTLGASRDVGAIEPVEQTHTVSAVSAKRASGTTTPVQKRSARAPAPVTRTAEANEWSSL